MNPIRVAIVDDHPLIRKGLYNMFQYLDNIQLTATYADGRSLLEGLKEQQPDILLLDIHLPDHSGETLARLISRDHPAIGVIALTNLDNVYYIRSMFKAGARGYVLKTAPEEVIVEAIQKVYNGERFMEGGLRELVLQASLTDGVQRNPQLLLTKREQEVLQLIASNLTSKEIAESLFLSKRTIDHHRNNLLLKLNVKNTAALIAKAIKLGLAQT
ncbi:response regulator [Taibaiella helva]|uniref:response regulator n=1 Tax=Taibaiella helva TaxID=2301235 RepID=UPI000E5675EE|nr:response regulator transcription factor [Taibaiella helva]